MEICYKCGVKTVTVYAFSIENFNRPKYEVEGLMQLAKVKLEQLTTYGDILDRYGASVRVLGQREMIRDDVLQVVDKAVARTKHNDKYGSMAPISMFFQLILFQSRPEHLLPIHLACRNYYCYPNDRQRLPGTSSPQEYTFLAFAHSPKGPF